MMAPKKISRCGRNYHLSLPKRWCTRVGLTAGWAVLIIGEIDGRPHTWRRRVVAHALGLHVAVPPVWRRWWELTYGSWVVLLFGDGPELTLQPLSGISPKEWELRGMIELLERLAEARHRVDTARAAGYAEGLATGYSLGIGAGLQIAKALPPKGGPLD